MEESELGKDQEPLPIKRGRDAGLPAPVPPTTDITALLCVITRQEQRELEDLLQTEDPEAFVVVLKSSEILGGFHTPDATAYRKRLQDPIR